MALHPAPGIVCGVAFSLACFMRTGFLCGAYQLGKAMVGRHRMRRGGHHPAIGDSRNILSKNRETLYGDFEKLQGRRLTRRGVLPRRQTAVSLADTYGYNIVGTVNYPTAG